MSSKLRKENLVWTISEDYSYVPTLNLFDEYQDADMNYYKMAVLGYVYKIIDMEKFLDFLSVCMENTNMKNEFLKTVEIFLDECFSDKLIEDRPGVEDYRKKFLKKITDKYKKIRKEDDNFLENLTVEEEIEYVYYSLLNNEFVQGRGVVEEMSLYLRRRSGFLEEKINDFVKNIEKADIIDEDKDKTAREDLTEDIISHLNGAFLKFFYENMRSENKEEKEDIEKKHKKDKKPKDEKLKAARLNFKMRKKHINKMKETDKLGMFSIESAEFTGQISDDIQIDDERLKGSTSQTAVNTNNKVKDMLLARYGESIYPDYITDFLESKLCTGIHEGIKLHFTQGKFVEGKYDKYFANSIQRQREKNIDYYKDNELIFRRSINELKEILRKKILLEEEDSPELTRSGELVVSKIWRNKVLGDEKIFMKSNKDQLGSLSVDILLDSSASQLEREELVSSQAYVIAEALTSLNIPTRVFGFCNFFNFLVMTEYRDYKDPITANKRIFNYKGSGSNRDGLPIRFLSKQMDSLEYDNRVLIVLSDGKPNDKIDLGTVGFLKVDGIDYEGDTAIKDTAQEVFNMKMRGHNVLGVFTGLDEDLDAEKKIYGKDFAYIRRLDRFSHIIGFYLEQLID
ncbi:hypothetical protein [Peptostreptococcus russellii]|uniref:hypothetical protein n=1 Tax=Peptostreptococcus russellii TaxID=215200 RepID=UPI001A9BBB8C|nr:hypothetical protein [Peptostreptococcus russellii]